MHDDRHSLFYSVLRDNLGNHTLGLEPKAGIDWEKVGEIREPLLPKCYHYECLAGIDIRAKRLF